MKKRQSGVLMHISSLPGAYGIGSFGQTAYDFVDFLVRTKQRYWQILPLGTTSYGDSPYQSFSAFAGNTHFIDLDILVEQGLLEASDLKGVDFGSDASEVDYAKIYYARRPLLEKAVKRFLEVGDVKAFEKFAQDNQSWLELFAEYMAIKEHFDNLAWTEWPDADARARKASALESYREKLADKLVYHRVTQYFFFQQWLKLKAYANDNHIEIVGDMPIYVAYDSADVWMHQEMFQLHKDGTPKAVAGCPPDYFAPQGQLWGNPLYDWERHKKDGYSWWIERMRYALRIFDCVRVDHFRGFDEYYSIPAGDDHAMNGTWEKGPGVELFDILKKHFAHQFEGGELPIIAEDLGLLTDSVTQLLEEVGFPGMKVLEFAFSSDCDNDYLPHNYPRNCVAYTGTHDNTTLRGWIDSLSEELRRYMVRYEGSEHTPHSDLHWDCIRTVLSSVADTVIIPMQDYLGLGNEARMNTPGTGEGNWQWRMREESFNDGLIWHCDLLSSIYGRNHKLKSEQK